MKNPVIPNYHADPFVYRDGEDYYMVCTTETNAWQGARFEIFHSRDLQNWSEPVEILHLEKDTVWADKMAWAPALVKKDGYWYFFFCGEQQIGVAVCDTPMGRYRDVLGKPLLGKNTLDTQTIDPSVFTDTDGKTYLIWGSSKCWITEVSLSPTDVHLVGEQKCLSNDFYWQRTKEPLVYDPTVFCKGADLVLYKGRYLLTWSIYDTRDYRYCIRYAWAQKVTGPYIQPLDGTHDNVLIHYEGEVLGTGHGNVVEKDGELYQFYHRTAIPRNGYAREICCDKVEFEDAEHIFAVPTR